jgi:hypothetical protein
MRQPPSGKAVANESKYPYIVELVVAGDKLDVECSRRMMDFHRSRKFRRGMDGELLEKAKSFFGAPADHICGVRCVSMAFGL